MPHGSVLTHNVEKCDSFTHFIERPVVHQQQIYRKGRIVRPSNHERMTTMYLASLIQGFAAWRRYRKAVQQLSELDERTLQDIGINRAQIREVALHGR